MELTRGDTLIQLPPPPVNKLQLRAFKSYVDYVTWAYIQTW